MFLTLLVAVLQGGEWAEGWNGHHRVQDSRFSLAVQEVVTVPEGLCVLVPCSFVYPHEGWDDPTPAHGYWFIQGTETDRGHPVATNNWSRAVVIGTQGRFHFVGNPQENSCTLRITDPRREDSKWYHFRVERGKSVRYNFVDNKFYLNVTGKDLAEMGWDLPPPANPCLSCWEGLWGVDHGSTPEEPHLGLQVCSLSSQPGHRSQLCTSQRPWSLGSR